MKILLLLTYNCNYYKLNTTFLTAKMRSFISFNNK